MKDLIEERSSTHGDYARTAALSQALRGICSAETANRLSRGQDACSPQVKESIDMILVKISRIISGDPAFRDHWEDIIGYAGLAMNGKAEEEWLVKASLSYGLKVGEDWTGCR